MVTLCLHYNLTIDYTCVSLLTQTAVHTRSVLGFILTCIEGLVIYMYVSWRPREPRTANSRYANKRHDTYILLKVLIIHDNLSQCLLTQSFLLICEEIMPINSRLNLFRVLANFLVLDNLCRGSMVLPHSQFNTTRINMIKLSLKCHGC